MIVFVRHFQGGHAGGFMALRMVRGGAWVPITGELEQSPDDAVQVCIRDLWSSIEELMELVRREVSMIQTNLVHLLDRAQCGEKVRIAGVWLTPDRDGLVMPRRRSKARFLGRADRNPIDITASLFDAMHAVLDLRGTSEDPAEMMYDLALERPAELLARIARQSPERLEEAARFVVQVFQAQRADAEPG